MGKLAREVWTDGWGDSLESVTDALGAVGSQMVDLGKSSPDEIRKLTKSALDLSEVMEVDVTEVTRAAGQMMKNGLAPDAQTAFDIIATGATNGANRSGDLLDTLTEYGPSFAAIGVDGPTALGMLNAALDAGIMSSDKAADAINEFGVRAIDGSKGTAEAYAALGLNADEMASKIAAGGPTATAAFSQINLSAAGGMPMFAGGTLADYYGTVSGRGASGIQSALDTISRAYSKIPGHALGGIVTGPHLAMVGEGGEDELILPLSKAPAVLGAAMGGNGRGGDIHIHMNNGFIGSKDDLARAIKDTLAYGTRTGAIPNHLGFGY